MAALVPLNRGWTYREQVGPCAAGATVLSYLISTRAHSTLEQWQHRLLHGEIELDGVRAGADQVLRSGQTLTWHRPPWDEPGVPTTFRVIHEDASIVAINKPSGLPTMPAGGYLDQTLLALVRARYPGASPLHRLGRHTSGLVLFARDAQAASALARAWRDRDVTKTYRALGHGSPRSEIFAIDAPIAPVPHPLIGTVHAACEGGRPAHSIARVLEKRDNETLFSVEITSGRPHQIRIHLAYAGHPLVGDAMYEAGGGLKDRPGLPGDGGYLLHAERLQFMHPSTRELMTLSATPPPELRMQEDTD